MPGARASQPTAPRFSRNTSNRHPSARYPESPPERTGWIVERRGARNRLDPRKAYAALVESERTESGEFVAAVTVFLTNRECPWRCLMCDLWRNTLPQSVPAGVIPEQIREALAGLAPARVLKLYNAGSFFDPRAIPPSDHKAIAAIAAPFERVVVECHPALVGAACFRFHDLIGGRLEVAIGLETAHPEALARLNKGMTTEDFRRAAAVLLKRGIPVRAFVLVGLPFLTPEESREWCRRSVEFAFDCGCTAVALIPTRAGNGALDALAEAGDFTPPTLPMLEACLADGIALKRGRVFADLWDLQRLTACKACFPGRAARLAHMNLGQTIAPGVPCPDCGGPP